MPLPLSGLPRAKKGVPTNPAGEMMITMIEQCFRNEDPTANPLLLEPW